MPLKSVGLKPPASLIKELRRPSDIFGHRFRSKFEIVCSCYQYCRTTGIIHRHRPRILKLFSNLILVRRDLSCSGRHVAHSVVQCHILRHNFECITMCAMNREYLIALFVFTYFQFMIHYTLARIGVSTKATTLLLDRRESAAVSCSRLSKCTRRPYSGLRVDPTLPYVFHPPPVLFHLH